MKDANCCHNRLGSACWYRPAEVKPGVQIDAGKWKPGFLRAWAMDWEDLCEHGGVPFPVGVIEDAATGACHSIYVTRICFADVSPGEEPADAP